MEQGPELFIPNKDNITAPAAITAIGTALVVHFISEKVGTAFAALTGTAADLDVVYEISIGHR